jgi:exodeoxyribonuclease V alpha subunit
MSHNLNPAAARIREILEARKKEREAADAAKAAAGVAQQHEVKHVPFAAKQPDVVTTPGAIVWNEQQLQAIQFAQSGKPFCLIGAAGTGKTTTVKEIVRQLRLNLERDVGKVEEGSIALVSYTNRAVRNIIRAVRDVGAAHDCFTIHKFLGYHPEWFDYEDEEGNWKKTMRFIPKFNLTNPINHCKLVVVDESSMVDVRLHQELVDACPNATFIYIGDLNQLTPVFGNAILGYKLDELPVVELTQVYRQAMESPIIAFQHNYTLAGKMPSDTELRDLNDKFEHSGLSFRPFKAQFPDGDHMAEAVANYMIRKLEEGVYDPDHDTILIPFNKSFGSDVINLHIAEYLAKRDHRVIYEIVAGFEKHYYAVDDFVMYEKRECKITAIRENRSYFGASPQLPSADLSRFGYIRTGGKAGQINLEVQAGADFELLLQATNGDFGADDSERKAAASHEIVMIDNESGQEFIAKSAGEVNSMAFGFAMTVHKSQGSEWRKVWLVLGKQHKVMLSREILYTGMTRAREHLEVIYTPQTAPGKRDNSIARCIKNQQIPGRTWREKAKYFKGKDAK